MKKLIKNEICGSVNIDECIVHREKSTFVAIVHTLFIEQ